ncbi:hypothetical protein [Luteipulveratus halotolerans]|uniref:Uncharacterized protein n=1 Tax=Luteipulveratus halotolerans TaxID=1631356 RepID=A0A0L6CEY5_9MICO|nr:hypothetical protein [Luteipulveratus halotolerans]KNX36058.1 hypothetical protein VV01_01050 [Luteipulveratus halotolerans]
MDDVDDPGWMIRHIYTTADSRFDRYVGRMSDLLERAEHAGWAAQVESRPVGLPHEVASALHSIRPGELVVCDLHGWVDDEDLLNVAATSTQAGVHLPCERTWASPAALVFSGCTSLLERRSGSWGHVRTRFAERSTDTMALMAHFAKAGFRDDTPLEGVRRVLAESPSGDAHAAFTALDVALYADRRGWFADLIEPPFSS